MFYDLNNEDKKAITLNDVNFNMAVFYRDANGDWQAAKELSDGEYKADNIDISVKLTNINDVISYEAKFIAEYDSQLRICLFSNEAKNIYHLIPCNIHGDNNKVMLRKGEIPVLSELDDSDVFCSPLWEFRADRASHPVSILCTDDNAIGITVEPYSDNNGEVIRNGLFCALPNVIGISLGYTNDPITFLNKREMAESTYAMAKSISAKGKIYACSGNGKAEAHNIIRNVYFDLRETARYKKSFKEAVKGLVEAYNEVNWSDEFKEYSNLACQVPENVNLKAWRPLVEIGWTGGGIIAYPFMLARHILGANDNQFKKTPERILEDICNGYNEKSGLLNDVTRPWDERWPNSRLNGWWTGFGLVEDKHCAYTNGSALYYMLRCYEFAKKHNFEEQIWLDTAKKSLDTVIELQREDGAYGKFFYADKKEVADYDGFAGCWFAAGCALLYRQTNDSKYLTSAEKAVNYYHQFVLDLNCYGTPMDTWNSIDEEGNLAFIKATRYLHEITGEKKYIDMAITGAKYEYLWRYCYSAKAEFAPLKDSSFNSCGGSVTSVSNPHIHPMGMIVNQDLMYIAKATGDEYHKQRAIDGTNFAMNILELYPETSGYGRYGVLTERYCPSDGLATERFSDGTFSSMWFSYNGWAAANVLEAICIEALTEK